MKKYVPKWMENRFFLYESLQKDQEQLSMMSKWYIFIKTVLFWPEIAKSDGF